MQLISFDSISMSVITKAVGVAFAARSRYVLPYHLVKGLQNCIECESYLVFPGWNSPMSHLELVLKPRADLDSGKFIDFKSQPKPVFSSDVFRVLANAMKHVESIGSTGISCEFLYAGVLDFIKEPRPRDGNSYLECWRRFNAKDSEQNDTGDAAMQ